MKKIDMKNTSSTLVFITEARFYKDGSGYIYCDSGFDQNLWTRYLSFFNKIVVFARVEKVKRFDSSNKILYDKESIHFIELPYYIGLKNLILKSYELRKILNTELNNYKDCSILIRVPGAIGYTAAKILQQNGKRYSVEVVGDPYEVFAKGNFNHPLRILIQQFAVYQLKFVVHYASVVLYVTQSALQDKYPAKSEIPTFAISDVRLPDKYIANNAKLWVDKPIYSVLCVGSLAQMYKGPDIVLKAIQAINKKNFPYKLNLTWLGDGLYKSSMQMLAQDLGIDKDVHFLGNVSSEEVFMAMNRADIYVLASRTEGLPRVIVEAMGKGLPIIATRVGGVPELLDEEALIEKNDIEALISKIIDFLNNNKLYNFQAKRNLIESHKFKTSTLDEKRIAFYSAVADA